MDLSVLGVSPVAAWIPSLDSVGNGTNTLYDLVGGNNGVITNATWEADGSLSFAGNGDVNFGDIAISDRTQDLAISLWFRRDGNPPSTESIFSKSLLAAADGRWWLNIMSSGVIRFGATPGDTASFHDTPETYTDNVWYHLYAKVSLSQTVKKLWIDGVLVIDEPITGFSFDTGIPFRLASYSSNNAPTYSRALELNGFLDDIRLYHSTDESLPLALYNNGRGNLTKGKPQRFREWLENYRQPDSWLKFHGGYPYEDLYTSANGQVDRGDEGDDSALFPQLRTPGAIFSNTNYGAEIDDDDVINLQDYSWKHIAMICRFDDIDGSGEVLWKQGGTSNGLAFVRYGSNGKLYGRAWSITEGWSEHPVNVGPVDIVEGQPHFVYFMLDCVDDTFKLFVDGELAATATKTDGNPLNAHFGNCSVGHNGSDGIVNGSGSTITSTIPFTGVVSDLITFNGHPDGFILYDADVRHMYQALQLPLLLPAQQCYIRNGTSSSSNFYPDDRVICKSYASDQNTQRKGYMQFDLSTVDRRVARATLRCWKADASKVSEVRCYGLNDPAEDSSWDQETISWDNYTNNNTSSALLPFDTSLDSTLYDTVDDDIEGSDYIEFDITDWVNLRRGDSFCTLGFSNNDTSQTTGFASFAGYVNNDHLCPQLILDFGRLPRKAIK